MLLLACGQFWNISLLGQVPSLIFDIVVNKLTQPNLVQFNLYSFSDSNIICCYFKKGYLTEKVFFRMKSVNYCEFFIFLHCTFRNISDISVIMQWRKL